MAPREADPGSVAFLVAELGRSGGMSVIRRHAEFLAGEGWDVALVVTDPKMDRGLSETQDRVPVLSLRDAANRRWGVAVATWWTTAESLWALDARRRAIFLQNVEHRFYREQEVPDQLAAMGVFDLPVDYLVIADYMVEMLSEMRPSARVHLVRNGVDKKTFTRPRAEGAARADPLRILIEGQPTLWFKGIAEALCATAAMSEPRVVTLVVHDLGSLALADLAHPPDRVLGQLGSAEMADLYADADVLLKLSRFEGSPLPPLEAFHMETPVVVTPFSGHEEQIADGINGLIVGFDDIVGTTRALDRLATDRDLLGRLSAGALESARRWPDQPAASGAFRDALINLLTEEEKVPEAEVLAAMSAGRRRTAEVARELWRRQRVAETARQGEVVWYADAYEQATATATEHHRIAVDRKAEIEDLAERLEEQFNEVRAWIATVEEIRQSRAYRLGLALRRPLDWLRGWRR